MIQAFAAYIEHAIITLGAGGVFLGSILEEVIVPIPSSLVQAGAGLFLLGGDPVSFTSIVKLVTWIAIPAALGVAIGSLLVYFLTYYGGMPAIRKFGKYFMLKPDRVEAARADIASRESTLITLTVLRFIPLLPNAFVTAAAGLLRIRFWPFIYSTLIGVFIRALYLGALGWLTGRISGSSGQTFYGKIGLLFIALLVISGLTALVIRYARKGKKKLS
jgi:membrane protein DedA with SNARE-associated domain